MCHLRIVLRITGYQISKTLLVFISPSKSLNKPINIDETRSNVLTII
jgi:hypothetical protein